MCSHTQVLPERLRQAFFTTPLFCSDLSHLINRVPFYLLGKQVVMIVSQCTYDEKVHVFSIWNAAFVNTHSGLGGTQQIFLVTPATQLKTPPPTPAQLFQVIPQ